MPREYHALRVAKAAPTLSFLLVLAAMSFAEISVVLSWDAPAGDAPNAYRVYWGQTSRKALAHPADFAYESFKELPASSGTSATVTSLADSTTHFFSVTAVSSGGAESPYSNEASFPAGNAIQAPATADAPRATRIHKVVFNASTAGTITLYRAPGMGVEGLIYRVNGELLCRLEGQDGRVAWNISDMPGVQAGTYVYEIRVPGDAAQVLARGRVAIVR